ncbi:BglG family transcription antiterminator [Plantibacter sp. YIM 135249]|uniref:BglG family transcription antiterminator n=1 Tax=Plantibacter sp. YIM 135249 TaxID=3423918 RepID=UPI003D33539C
MAREKHERMLGHLAKRGSWTTATELADLLGVTPRSVRSYVTAVNTRAAPHDVVESGPSGYRLNADGYAVYRQRAASAHESETPKDRLYGLVRLLIASPQGIDVFETARSLHVSESTVEGDLTRVRSMLAETTLTLERSGSTVTMTGGETERRRLLSRMFRDETDRGLVELEALQRAFAPAEFGPFKGELIASLTDRGYYVNEYGVANVLLHIAIAVDRVAKDRPVEVVTHTPQTPEVDVIAVDLARLVTLHFDVTLSDADLVYLAYLLVTRVITPGSGAPAESIVDDYVNAGDLAAVREAVRRAGEEYLVDLSDEDFIVRLTLHVQNLIRRAHDQSYSRNPLTRSIKTSYPMIYELAVFIASQLQRHGSIVINDDEIAYIAMHVGAQLEQNALKDTLLGCTIVSPGYYDMHEVLRTRVETLLGDVLDVRAVVTRSDVDWSSIDTELVLTTIEPPTPADGIVLIQPFLTAGDVERVRTAVSRVRRAVRLTSIKDELLQYFHPELFVRNAYAKDEESMIRLLGERMIARGVIDEGYVTGAIERERMSSTAFTDTLAVPHAMAMSATSTAIAIAVNETPMDWGGARVSVVALVAFSESDRAAFQTVFDQFVEVFSERASVARIIRRSDDFGSFIDELVHVIDD